MAEPARDCWADWLAERRHGGDPDVRRRLENELAKWRDKVLDSLRRARRKACAGYPRIPTLGEAMEQTLTPAEREELERHLRPLVEEGRGTWRMASAYLRAEKS